MTYHWKTLNFTRQLMKFLENVCTRHFWPKWWPVQNNQFSHVSFTIVLFTLQFQTKYHSKKALDKTLFGGSLHFFVCPSGRVPCFKRQSRSKAIAQLLTSVYANPVWSSTCRFETAFMLWQAAILTRDSVDMFSERHF